AEGEVGRRLEAGLEVRQVADALGTQRQRLRPVGAGGRAEQGERHGQAQGATHGAASFGGRAFFGGGTAGTVGATRAGSASRPPPRRRVRLSSFGGRAFFGR